MKPVSDVESFIYLHKVNILFIYLLVTTRTSQGTFRQASVTEARGTECIYEIPNVKDR